jgi:hypothetical protein
MFDTLVRPKPELSSPSYGFGFGVTEGPGGRRVGHSGGFPGISAQLDIFLDTGYVAVVLANVDNGSGAVAQKIRELIERVR